MIAHYDGYAYSYGNSKYNFKLWDVTTENEVRVFHESYGHDPFMFSPDKKYILSWFYNSENSKRAIMLWDTATGRKVRTFSADEYGSKVAFTPDSTRIIISYDDTIKLWDIATGVEIRTFPMSIHWNSSIVFSPDGTQIIACSDDGTIILWNIDGMRLRNDAVPAGQIDFNRAAQLVAGDLKRLLP